jgi:hypothetical protein
MTCPYCNYEMNSIPSHGERSKLYICYKHIDIPYNIWIVQNSSDHFLWLEKDDWSLDIKTSFLNGESQMDMDGLAISISLEKNFLFNYSLEQVIKKIHILCLFR